MKLLSLVFSFRNEEENLEKLVEKLNTVLSKLNGWNFEYIFVNDDSTDNSEKILVNLQNIHPIKIVNLSRKFGLGPGILAGFESARGDALVYMDSDLQDPPEMFTKMYENWKAGYKVVYGVRKKREGSFLKLLAYYIYHKVFNLFAKLYSKPN